MSNRVITIPDHATMVANIRDVFDSANERQIADGLDWYADSHRIVMALAAQYGYSVSQVAGVIAAVSPLNSWGANVNLAGRILANHYNGTPQTSGYLQAGLIKANAILDGTDVLDVLKSNKIRAFYLCIASAGNTDYVCIDRHAYSIAVGERITDVPTISGKRWDAISTAYAAVAIEKGIHAAKVQAITWVAWRNRFWSVGAFDGK